MSHNHRFKRAEREAQYIVDNRCTIRQAAQYFNRAKTSLHYDITYFMSEFNPDLAHELRGVLDENWDARQTRGGVSTKAVWEKHRDLNSNKERSQCSA